MGASGLRLGHGGWHGWPAHLIDARDEAPSDSTASRAVAPWSTVGAVDACGALVCVTIGMDVRVTCQGTRAARRSPGPASAPPLRCGIPRTTGARNANTSVAYASAH